MGLDFENSAMIALQSANSSRYKKLRRIVEECYKDTGDGVEFQKDFSYKDSEECLKYLISSTACDVLNLIYSDYTLLASRNKDKLGIGKQSIGESQRILFPLDTEKFMQQIDLERIIGENSDVEDTSEESVRLVNLPFILIDDIRPVYGEIKERCDGVKCASYFDEIFIYGLNVLDGLVILACQGFETRQSISNKAKSYKSAVYFNLKAGPLLAKLYKDIGWAGAWAAMPPYEIKRKYKGDPGKIKF